MQKTKKEAAIGKRALIYSPPPLHIHYARITGRYGGSKYGGNYYHVALDDGDEGDCTWKEFSIGMRLLGLHPSRTIRSCRRVLLRVLAGRSGASRK